MVSPACIAVIVAQFATCVLSQDGRLLANFLQLRSGSSIDGGPEEHVARMRDVFFDRVRCGSQQGMPSKVCQECLSTRRILNITRGLNASAPSETSLQDLTRASVVILNYLLSFQTSCTVESMQQGYVGSCRLYEQCLSDLRGRLSPTRSESSQESLQALEGSLREMKTVFEPDPSKQCFSAETVLKELNTRRREFEKMPRDVATVLLITGHLFLGECIDVGESVADFLDDIFLHYGDGCERVMSQSGFTKLWNDLQMQRRGKHVDHGMQKSACVNRNVDFLPLENTEKYTPEGRWGDAKKTDETYDYSSTPVPTVSVVTRKLSVLDAEVEKSADTPKNPNLYILDGEERVDKENVEVVTSRVPVSNRRVRHTVHPQDHEHKNLANECLPSDDLLQRFLMPGNKVITSSAFLQLCPALVQQAVSGVCNAKVKSVHLNGPGIAESQDVFEQVSAKNANPWFAVLAVTAITAASLLGLFLLPVLKKSFFMHINAFFTGLAFGTMSGDVVLHIMPQYLGLHKHDNQGHDHDTESLMDRLFPSHLQRQLAFLTTMYVLFLVECMFSAFTGEENNHQGHSHEPIDIPMRDLTVVSDAAIKPKLSLCSRIVHFLKPSNLLTGISSKAVVIVLADTVHNFADGMAIAVGFSTSYKDGISTSVAVLFHELPHEIGDFAVLMNSGMCYWKAFVFNILSGLSAFLGLGVGVFSASVFREWLLCITAGLFFFVVMVELLPDMRLESKSKWRAFVVKIFGTVLGIGAMICIAMYELYAS